MAVELLSDYSNKLVDVPIVSSEAQGYLVEAIKTRTYQ